MRAVVQRVSSARVVAAGEETGRIGRGLLIFLGIHKSDTEEDLEWLCNKILNLRVFEDDEGRMNRSVSDEDGEVMVISQFTVFGNVRKGSRPSFNNAANPEKGRDLYRRAVVFLAKQSGKAVATGRFAEHMDIEANNDGPVTVIIDTHDKRF